MPIKTLTYNFRLTKEWLRFPPILALGIQDAERDVLPLFHKHMLIFPEKNKVHLAILWLVYASHRQFTYVLLHWYRCCQMLFTVPRYECGLSSCLNISRLTDLTATLAGSHHLLWALHVEELIFILHHINKHLCCQHVNVFIYPVKYPDWCHKLAQNVI